MFLAALMFGEVVMQVGFKGVRRLLEKTRVKFRSFHVQWSGLGVFFLLVSAAIQPACTNIKFADRKLASEFFLPDQNSVNGASFKINSLFPASGGGVYELIGQNGEFDNYCSGNFGACSCVYTYTIGSNVNQIAESQVTYQESNMLRCPNAVPTGAATFSVKIQTQAGSNGGPYFSNSLSLNLEGGGTFENSVVYADLSNERSYLEVKRYQCRRNDFIPSPFDSGFLDPIQSQDPRIIYPFNFYTTNVGESILAIQRNGTAAGWECTLTPTFNYSLHWWANPMVFSSAPCTSAFCVGDGELIYPSGSLESGRIPASLGSTATGKRRSSFSLLPRAYGVFDVPVIAAAAPRDLVSPFYSGQNIDAGLTLSPLGYAARPVIAADGGSACPNITIPPNARWVKLWNFRATDLASPRRVQSTIATLNHPIACLSSEPDDLFDSCYFHDAPSNSGSIKLPVTDASGSASMASRIAFMDVNGSGGGGRDSSACYKLNAYDTFEASLFAFNYETSEAESLLRSYPWGVYSTLPASPAVITESMGTGFSMPGGGTSDTLRKLLTGIPRPTGIPTDVVGVADTLPLSQDLFSDHLFVITDPSVRVADFQNLNSSESNNYRPVTYRSRGACPGNSRATCLQDQVNWELNTKNINQPLGPEVYPLCVLQFSD
jgi:hypothetical protein